jgi:hypothetical protein
MSGIIDVRTGTITVPASDTVTAGTVTEVFDHVEFGNTVFKAPALEGTGTGTFRLIDPLLGTINEVITAESTTKLGTPVFEFYRGTLTLTATTTNATDGTQSAARAFTYNIYYKAKHG